MSFGGHIQDMITRMKQNREMTELRRQRRKGKQTYLNSKPTGMPRVTIEQLDEISRKTKEREEQQASYSLKLILIILAALLAIVLVVWWVNEL